MDAVMFRTKSYKQGKLLDPWEVEMGPKRYKLLENSWAKIFHEELLPSLPTKEMARAYDETFGRPTKEMSSALGAILLQQIHDLTDEQTVEQFAFNQLWQYALDITSSTDDRAYICEKTIWNTRNTVIALELEDLIFEQATARLTKAFDVDTSSQRLDSVHIKSNMRKLSRVGIFARSMHKFLVNLRRHHRDEFAALDKELVSRYLTEKAVACFARVKPSDAKRKLSSLAKDLHSLVAMFADHRAVSAMHSYKLLARVQDEHCALVEDSRGELTDVRIKPPKEVPSDSLQNPSDPDASYSKHKGQGYQVQVAETYTPAAANDGEDAPNDEKATTKASESKAEVEDAPVPTLNLITHVEVERAHEHDVHALTPAIESLQERNLGPETLLADTLYGSDENCAKAQDMGVELIAPNAGVSKRTVDLDSFVTDENGVVLRCPNGATPLRTKKGKTGVHSAAFSADVCVQCPMKESCPAKNGSNGKRRYVRYRDKELRLAKRRAHERSSTFEDVYRMRAGIEGTMSQYDRRTGVKKLRVRGAKAVKFCAVLKAIGVNLVRATQYCVQMAQYEAANANT